MRATCPTCETAYTIPDDRIGPKGRKVRCTKCGDEWRVMPGAEEEAWPDEPPARAPAPAPVAATPAPVAAPDPFDMADADFDAAPAAPPPAAQAAAPPEPPRATVEVAAEAAPEPEKPRVTVPAARVRIRTKRRFPKVRMPDLGVLGARVRPFVGPTVFLAAAVAVTAVVTFRTAIVAAAPDLAGLYGAVGMPVNLRGLVFGRIETLREIDNGQPVLVVEGSISNATHQLREVPALRFALRGPDTQELYAWSIDPKSTAIESGDTIRFRTRLAAPPDQATEIQVRFVERRSHQAGLP